MMLNNDTLNLYVVLSHFHIYILLEFKEIIRFNFITYESNFIICIYVNIFFIVPINVILFNI